VASPFGNLVIWSSLSAARKLRRKPAPIRARGLAGDLVEAAREMELVVEPECFRDLLVGQALPGDEQARLFDAAMQPVTRGRQPRLAREFLAKRLVGKAELPRDCLGRGFLRIEQPLQRLRQPRCGGRFDFRFLRHVAEELLQAADAPQHAGGVGGQSRRDDRLQSRQPVPDLGQMPDGILRLQEPEAPPEIEDRTVEDDEKFAPKFVRTRRVTVRNFRVDEKQVARTNWNRGMAAPFHAAAAVEQINHGVLAERPHIVQRNPPAIALVTGKSDLSQRRVDRGVIGHARSLHHIGHAKTYMFFPTASIGSAVVAWDSCSMQLVENLALSSIGNRLDASENAFGELRDSSYLLSDSASLHARLREDGYLFVRGFFKRDDVLGVRREFVNRIAALGNLEPGTDPMDAILRKDGQLQPFSYGWGLDNPKLKPLLFSGRILDFYRDFFGEAVRHFDETWLRLIGPGLGSQPHCDVVYMGRGTREKLMTAWVPIGDVPLHVGGLMILEGSHLQHERLAAYLNRDVDAYCTNVPDAAKIEDGFNRGVDLRTAGRWTGSLSKNPATLREKLGGRWLTTEFQAGDLLTFTMHTVHASLDNQSNRYRMSTDTRYQPASLPIDERWIGEKRTGHGFASKRGRIC
jgi:hypothetical protein